ncbi:malonate decarboxylase subunit epsilon [Streptomyces sp. J2-1]|uniref:ACP S-malonyltransferase n=1 Tax=Streptomyces corallincola TaxID=2851888 RepID=UPI001C38603B|nr:malonate decarboxylase subunit epsilon [Streptomyces corallincola]MBV2353880.1 malonate decarboxylase subunit epsilon [Streptomyces corallincola]
MSTVFLFSGQGEQYPGMLADLPRHPAARAVLDEVSRELGHDVGELDDREALRSNANVQVALFTAAVASWRVVDALGGRAEFVAGHSIGAFGAAVASGALSLTDALGAVRVRGRAMEAAYPSGYGMGVVLGLDERAVAELAERAARPGEPVYATNVNAPRQIAVSGADPAVDRVLELAGPAGATKAERLRVNVPAHCPLMSGPEEQLAAVLRDVKFAGPTVPYAANRTGRTLRSADQVREDLIRSAANPVRWHDAVSVLYERGARLFVQMWPGDTLSRLAATAFPDARATSLRETGPDHVLELVRREAAGSG